MAGELVPMHYVLFGRTGYVARSLIEQFEKKGQSYFSISNRTVPSRREMDELAAQLDFADLRIVVISGPSASRAREGKHTLLLSEFKDIISKVDQSSVVYVSSIHAGLQNSNRKEYSEVLSRLESVAASQGWRICRLRHFWGSCPPLESAQCHLAPWTLFPLADGGWMELRDPEAVLRFSTAESVLQDLEMTAVPHVSSVAFSIVASELSACIRSLLSEGSSEHEQILSKLPAEQVRTLHAFAENFE